MQKSRLKDAEQRNFARVQVLKGQLVGVIERQTPSPKAENEDEGVFLSGSNCPAPMCCFELVLQPEWVLSQFTAIERG